MIRQLGRCAVILGLAGAAVVGGAACASDRPAATAPPGSAAGIVPTGSLPPPVATQQDVRVDTVAMVGDSITVGSQAALEEGFAALGLGDVQIDAVSGRRILLGSAIGSGLTAVETIAARATPDLWVIALGTNDVANYTPEEYGPAITRLMAAIPADAPLVWVDTYLDGYPEEANRFNTTLRRVLSTRGRAIVVDWASVADEDGVLTDGVHPSGFGIEEFTRRVVAAVDTWVA